MSGLKLHLLLLSCALGLLIAGCATFDGLNSRIVPPTLLERVTLPPPPASLAARDFYLKMEILVGKDGSVRHVSLTKSSGDAEWDAAAVRRIMEWKYSPALLDDKPIQMRIIQTARVVTVPPVMMTLSELVCSSFSRADSAYGMLKDGAAFDSVAAIYGCRNISMVSGYVGEVDINRFPDDIRGELHSLNQGMFTHPLAMGPYFAIFMKH